MYEFNVKKAVDGCVEWIRNWFRRNGDGCTAVLGISGGKDSSVTAALLVKALGKDRVFGVLMPKGIQSDIEDSHLLCSFLGIKSTTVNVGKAVNGIENALTDIEATEQAKINLPPRVRMATLYYVSQSINGRVANTCNLSEDYVGYSTRYGDSVGDFAPLCGFTVTEVKQIGLYLGLPERLVIKPPSDGLCGRTDEDNLGFTYDVLDKYIREGIEPEEKIKQKIDRLHEQNLFKLRYMDTYYYQNDR